MRFLVDECTGPNAAAWLRGQGYEVFSAFEQSRGADDDVLLEKAFRENWVLITNDKDFGEKVYRERRLHHGVIFLRLNDERAANKVLVLERLLAQYMDQLTDRFIVVTDERVRFAGIVQLPPEPEQPAT
jgi:predicted nuclease of predicted toxin-antitoxin system